MRITAPARAARRRSTVAAVNFTACCVMSRITVRHPCIGRWSSQRSLCCLEMSTSRAQVDIRMSNAGDDDAILALLQASLGWVPDDLFARFFEWKHRQSPFGVSPPWVALDGERVIGFRTFMRWEFEHEGRPRRAIRAVDTATHPDYQGRGI